MSPGTCTTERTSGRIPALGLFAKVGHRRYRVLVSYTPGHVAPRYPRLIINIMRKCMTTLIEKMIDLWEEELQDEEVFRHIRGPNES